jgi:predicted dehydrogenase
MLGLDFGSGFSTFTCSTLISPYQNVQILGDRGRIEIQLPFNTHPDRPCKIIHQNQEGQSTEILFEPCDQFTILVDLFSQSVIENTLVPMPLTDAVSNMKVLEAIIRSNQSNQWVSIL